MPWFKVDDTLAVHHKVVAAGNAAMGLWVRAGAWSSQQLTDGFVPDHMISVLGNTAQARRLCEVRLWHRCDGGYLFHEFADRQPSRAQTEARREDDRKRKAEARAAKRAAANGVREDVSR